jgi:alpha-L-rhamnosidase
MTDQLTAALAPYGLRREHRSSRRPGCTRCGTTRPRFGSAGTATPTSVSVHGTTAVGWSIVDGELKLDVTVPPAATVHVPTADPEGVRGLPVREAAGVRVVHAEFGTLVCRLTSGEFPFTSELQQEST